MAIKTNDVRHIKSFNLEPKLRMFANGSQEVNEIRSEFQGALKVKGVPKFEVKRELNMTEMPELTRKLTKKKSADEPRNILTNIFVRLTPDNTDTVIPGTIVQKGTLVSARVPLTQLSSILDKKGVINIETSRGLRLPRPKIEVPYASKPVANILKDYHAKYTAKKKSS